MTFKGHKSITSFWFYLNQKKYFDLTFDGFKSLHKKLPSYKNSNRTLISLKLFLSFLNFITRKKKGNMFRL